MKTTTLWDSGHVRSQDFFSGVGKLGVWGQKCLSGIEGFSPGGLRTKPPSRRQVVKLMHAVPRLHFMQRSKKRLTCVTLQSATSQARHGRTSRLNSA